MFKNRVHLELSVQGLALANAVVLMLLWALSIWRWRLSPDFIPLHYTLYFGFDRFGPRHDIFLFASLATVLVAVNWFMARAIFAKNVLWQAFLLALTLFFEIILLTSLVLVVLKHLA